MNFMQKYGPYILIGFVGLGFFYPMIGYTAIICMAAPWIVAYWKGRQWCGNFCPRGAFYNRFIAPISRNQPIPKWVRTPATRIAVMIGLFSFFGYRLYAAHGDIAKIGFAFVLMVAMTTVIGIVLGILYSPRTWCAVCPMGAMAAGVTHLSGYRNALTVSHSCVSCKRCETVCPFQIGITEYRNEAVIADPDCLHCHSCMKTCKKNAISTQSCQMQTVLQDQNA
ncbi:4Fe-4S binding protein [Heliobacterium chlorum]|uniref:4Fe-4S binding protein n=1 Tax=Heliobacterium chlorum TaxID=2698 RepID=A0ABR7T1K1_HELCL|nr:4Fe-4S binding protein [Heliobacterium chlorum]MBC9784077.1 4Fe-4S binding protein [Heliobacterium chlorum]